MLDTLMLARWQFGITTVYHFLIVPLSIGLILLVAVMQTLHVITKRDEWIRLTRFFGHLFTINFALGVATGLVQEFQFGMTWASYSRYVGDIFGAPLAMEGLLAFFMESTFLGLWIFGWGRLPRLVHLACAWMVVLGTNLSALFILAANSFMQHPVGYHINDSLHRAEMTDFGAIIGNPTLWVAFPHTIAAAVLTGSLFVTGVSAWFLLRGRDVDVFRRAVVLGLLFALIASLGTLKTGDSQAKVMTQQQPMKMAAAEALYETQSHAPFSLFAVGTLDGSRLIFDVTVPGLLSWLATGDFNGTVEGINNVQQREEALYGPGSYTPIIPVTYWTFRIMAGVAFVTLLFSLWGLYLAWRRRLAGSRWFNRAAVVVVALPFVANTAGWVFTEMGRQPWVVYGLFKTANGVSPTVPVSWVVISLAGFTILYGALAVIDGWLMGRVIGHGLEEAVSPDEPAPVLVY